MGKDQKNAFLAVILSAIVLFAWQAYMGPTQQISPEVQTAVNNSNNEPSKTVNKPVEKVEYNNSQANVTQAAEIQTYTLTNNDYSFVVTNNLIVKDVINPKAVFKFDKIVGSDKPVQLRILTTTGSEELFFDMTQESSTTLKGINSKYGINLTLALDEKGRLRTSLNSNQANFKYRFMFTSKDEMLENRQVRNYLAYSTDINRIAVGDDAVEDGRIKWVGIDFNYHLFSFVFDTKVTSKYVAKENGELGVDVLDETNTFNGYFIFTKKNYDTLVNLGDKLDLSVDFGVFGILAVPILRGLQFCYDLFPNYGLAIILITLLVRMITFPLQYKSFKSMKKMQKVQPELAKIKERFKDDPQRMQKETMELFKRAGANPLGGCLPLLAQMPVFFAFYQVLQNSVELVDAPFLGWITDLSIKDPFYVLPILMGVVMFFQNKLNPSAGADPTQKKVMMFMPLIFCFIMKDFPAGLNLYMIVSMGFGIIQQLFVYKTVD